MEGDELDDERQPNPLARQLGLHKSTAAYLVEQRRRSQEAEEQTQLGESAESARSESTAG